jgi:hypothetical protein
MTYFEQRHELVRCRNWLRVIASRCSRLVSAAGDCTTLADYLEGVHVDELRDLARRLTSHAAAIEVLRRELQRPPAIPEKVDTEMDLRSEE